MRKAPEERRADIVAAARRLFVRKGVAETSISEIVASAGVAHGTFYLYFPSKEEALNAVVEDLAGDVCAAIEGVLRSSEIGALEKFARSRDIMLGAADEKELVEYYLTKGDRHFYDELGREVDRRLAPAIVEAITQGVADGTFHVTDPEAAAHVVLAASSMLHGVPGVSHQLVPERRSEAYWSFVMRGLGCAQTEEER